MTQQISDKYLARLSEQVNKFEDVAFRTKHASFKVKKRQMKDVSRAICNYDLRYIIGRSIDWVTDNPEFVRGAINQARSHIESLRENRTQALPPSRY